MLGNLFGTLERARYLFRDTLPAIDRLVTLKSDPGEALRNLTSSLGLGRHALNLLPRKVRRGPVLEQSASLARLPQLVSWPDDGGAFITLPQVYSEAPGGGGFQ